MSVSLISDGRSFHTTGAVRNAKYMSVARPRRSDLQTPVEHEVRQSEEGQGHRSSILVLVLEYSQTP